MTSAVLTAIAVVGAGLIAPAPAIGREPPAEQATAVSKPRHEAASAVGSAAWAAEQARIAGRRVPVPSEHREAETVYANADGSFTSELSIEPVRVRRGSGWVPVDTTLVRRPDGSLAPVATTMPVVFSGGGDQPMVRIGQAGRQLTLRWPGRLPRPVPRGDMATYPDVLPGVDLRLRATPQGYSKVLVVKSRAAADQRALRKLVFGLRSDGVSMRTDRNGNLAVYDARGAVALGVGAPLMWDSTRPEPRRALSTMRVSAGRMTLIPDRRLLTDPATRFPVHIDPDTDAPRTGFAQVFSGYPGDAYWGGDGSGVAKVGRCYEDGTCNGVGVGRAYFRFLAEGVIGKHILRAEFNAFLAYSPSCQARKVEGWGTNPVGPGTTWGNQPGTGGGASNLGWHDTALGWSGSCPANYLGWNAKPAVENAVRYSNGVVTILLKALDEGDQLAWKKFLVNNSTPTLSVTYNSYPGAPYALSVEDKGCKVAPDEPYLHPVVDDDPDKGPRGPRLWARIADADGGLVHAQFEWYTRGGARLGVTSTAQLQSGGYFSVDVPAVNAPDQAKLAFRVRGADGIDFGPWSGMCDVTIDRTAPRDPPAVSSATYPECKGPDSCPVGGGAGRTGAFTLATGGDPDVTGFRYALHDQPDRYVAAGTGGTAAILITPPEVGLHNLYTRSVDRAGNLGPLRTYPFVVGRGTPPRGHWRLDGVTSAEQVVDDSPNGHDGVRPGVGSAWQAGRHDDALWLSGSSRYVSTVGGQTVRTDHSFTVAAWVRLDRLDTSVRRTAVSQDGNTVSGFALQYDPATKKWVFGIPAGDVDGAAYRMAASPTEAVANRWTHLVGVYDLSSKQVRLFVDGVASTTASHTTPWNATGTVQLGRAKVASAPAEFWPGLLDDVRIYDRTLSTTEIAELVNSPTTEQVFLPFDEGQGTAVLDASGKLRIGALGSSVTRTAGQVGTGALQFDGGTDTAATEGPVVDTDSSFTVSARVRLAVADDSWRTVLSQQNGDGTGFALSYRGDTRKWTFSLSRPGSGGVVTVDSTEPAEAGAWTHLAGVYDVASRTIRLYVDTASMGSAQADRGWPTGGAFQLGRSMTSSGPSRPFAGQIDDVHAWSGARTDDQIRADALEPVTTRRDQYGGQVSRYYNTAGFRVVTTGPVPPGSHLSTGLGFPAPSGAQNTRPIYSCRNGATDYFLSTSALCEGKVVLGAIGRFYTEPPAGVPSFAIRRCLIPNVGHYASTQANCEDDSHVTEMLLGYTLASGSLVRYLTTGHPWDHASSAQPMPAPYRPERVLGFVPRLPEPGTVELLRCQRGEDAFSSTDPGCEGGTVLGRTGYLWTGPPDGGGGVEIFRCRASWGDLFDSTSPTCEGHPVDRSLGFARNRATS